MATKSDCLLSKSCPKKQNPFTSNDNHQFNNFNLNQNSKDFDNQEFNQFKNKSLDKSKSQNNVLNVFDKSPKIPSHSFNKKDKSALNKFPSTYLNGSRKEENQKEWEQEENNSKSSSTLSLHIFAYENDFEIDNLNNVSSNNKSLIKNKQGFEKSLKDLKQNFGDYSKKNLFEIPRQQKEKEKTEPEIMQFKASQKLLNPNQENSLNIEFERLKENANKLFREEKYNEAVKAYTEILQLSELSPENKAVIFSNRSASNLLLGSQHSAKIAKSDAQKAIKLRPSWWKGYFRMARVQMELEEWFQAEKTLAQALTLNSGSKEIRDEISFVRSKIGSISREEHLGRSPKSSEQPKKENTRFGMPEEIYHNYEKLTKSLPGIGDILKGHQFLNGNGERQDFKKAAEFYAKAANMGYPEGMYNLGQLYYEGNGVKRDYKEAMKWFLKAANLKPSDVTGSKGIAEAQHAIGLNYMEGVGVEKDCQKAAQWYEKAVQNGYGPSANNLGSLYKYGTGVEKSSLKAFNYFKYAAEAGETSGMFNLAMCYFTDVGFGSRIPSGEDSAEGKKWLKLAAEKGDVRAIEDIKEREKLEKRFNTDEEAMKYLSQQLENKDSRERKEKNPLDFEQFGKYVSEAARKGSVTAQNHMKIWNNMNDASKAFKKNDFNGLVASLSKAIQINPLIVDIPSLYESKIEERIKTHSNELDTIICYIQMKSEKLCLSKLITDSFKKFPTNEYLTEVMCYNIVNVASPKDALKYINDVLKLHPASLHLLFCRVRICCMHILKTKEVLQASDEFLAIAPKDHPNVPACYYSKAEYHISTEDDLNFIKCFEAGVSAEKKQLPCFLPYNFEGRSLLEMAYGCIKSKLSIGKKSEDLERIKFDPKRKLLVIKNRESFVTYAEGETTSEVFTEMVIKPSQIPLPPNWSSSSNKITFKDMDPTKDKVYNGCILEVRILDWAYLSASIHTIIEDENGDIRRFALFNWPLSGEQNADMIKIIKTFCPNVKMLIVNPYHCMIDRGQNIIRVEGPDFIKFDTSKIDKLCHVCGKEAKIRPCSVCKMAFYCSKDCQKIDWREFNHKSICKHLKNFMQI